MFGLQMARKGALIYSIVRHVTAPRDTSKQAASVRLRKPEPDFFASKSTTLLQTGSERQSFKKTALF